MQDSMGTRWECVAGGWQSTYLGISQSEQGRLVSGQNLTLCNTGSRSRPVRVSLPFLTKMQRLGNGMRGSRVIVRPHFKGHYNGIAYTCAASSRSSGSAKEDVREGTGAKQEIGGCINGETKTTKTKDVALPGLIPPPLTTVGKSTNIQWEGCMVQREERERMLDQKGCVIWITGLSGSGKSTLACALDHALLERGKLSYVLDGDNVRHGLNNNLGFSAEDRAENIRRVGEVAKLFADTGVICIASFISPYRKDRDSCREMMHSGDFIEVFMDVALEVCEQRDRKGLYKLARAGKIKGFTGIDDPYEDPPLPEIVMGAVDGVYASPEAMAAIILTYLGNNGFLKGP